MVFLRILLAISTAHAATLDVTGFNFGSVDYTLGNFIENIITVLYGTILPVCMAVFAVGALTMTASMGRSDWQSAGKNMMIGSLIGAAIVLGARGILGLVTYFLYF